MLLSGFLWEPAKVVMEVYEDRELSFFTLIFAIFDIFQTSSYFFKIRKRHKKEKEKEHCILFVVESSESQKLEENKDLNPMER